MDMFSDREWFAAVSQVGMPPYELAVKELGRQGYRVFAPLCRKERRHAGKVEVVERPLFDRYLFVGLDSEQPFHPITSTRGVSFVVRGLGGVPSRVSPIALRRVKARCDAFEGGVVDFTPAKRKEMAAKWETDQPVKITAGPFRDFIGLFVGATGDQVQIALSLFGRPTTATVSAQHLEPMAPAA